MKHIFIINPTAGQGLATDYISEIERQLKARALSFAYDGTGRCEALFKEDALIFKTRSAKDGEKYTRKICDKLEQEKYDGVVRFYAIGGDGTLHEVVNGCVGRENSEVAHIPAGTGNDFTRNFGSAEEQAAFTDISAQIDGTSMGCDLIRYDGYIDGRRTSRYAVNMINIGLDCNVVDLTSRVKQIPFIKGSLAYYLSAIIIFIKKKGADLKIEYSDGTIYNGKLILIAIGNGDFCGGGIKAVPKASVDDGRFDILTVKDASRMDFINFFQSYKEGTHLEDEGAKHLFDYKKGKRIVITPNGDEMKLCADGEISYARRVEFEIDPYKLKFVIPKGVIDEQHN